ncbi:MAG TPA: hypothetical protein VMM78_01845 [Thermomicrobiales bacterium]|nr:hypothetical protein [Thermomicrobiales bacterium]
MSQPCSLLELLLVDARDLALPATRRMLEFAAAQAIPHGALRAGESVDAPIDHADALDFWLSGDEREWPFARAAAFAGVEEGRTLFASMDPVARAAAASAGLVATVPNLDVMERMLP